MTKCSHGTFLTAYPTSVNFLCWIYNIWQRLWMVKKSLVLHSVYFIFLQYKFYVDGEWRHDEHQPFVNGNGGVMNTILITLPDMVPTGFSPSNMDVDDFSQQMVRIIILPYKKVQCFDLFAYLLVAYCFCVSNAVSIYIRCFILLFITNLKSLKEIHFILKGKDVE